MLLGRKFRSFPMIMYLGQLILFDTIKPSVPITFLRHYLVHKDSGSSLHLTHTILFLGTSLLDRELLSCQCLLFFFSLTTIPYYSQDI